MEWYDYSRFHASSSSSSSSSRGSSTSSSSTSSSSSLLGGSAFLTASSSSIGGGEGFGTGVEDESAKAPAETMSEDEILQVPLVFNCCLHTFRFALSLSLREAFHLPHLRSSSSSSLHDEGDSGDGLHERAEV